MDVNIRMCKKCLLREMPEKAFYKNMYDYMDGIPKEDRAEDRLYEERLSVCKECSHLLSGMCRLCGCYVELRALMKVRSCPALPSKW